MTGCHSDTGPLSPRGNARTVRSLVTVQASWSPNIPRKRPPPAPSVRQGLRHRQRERIAVVRQPLTEVAMMNGPP